MKKFLISIILISLILSGVFAESTAVASKKGKFTVNLDEFYAMMAAQEETHQRILAQQKAAAEAAAKAEAEKVEAPTASVNFTPEMLRNRILVTDNDLRVVDVNSDLFNKVETLYIILGKAMPSATGPWTVGEIKDMMANISEDDIAKASVKDLYVQIMKALDSKVMFDFGLVKVNLLNIDCNFGMYYLFKGNYGATEKDFQNNAARSEERFTEKYPIVTTGAEIYLSKYVYGKFTASFKDDASAKLYWETFSTNFNCLIDRTVRVSMLDYTVLASAGVENFSVIVGNDYLSWNDYGVGSMIFSPVTKLKFVQASYHDNAGKLTMTSGMDDGNFVTAAKAEYNRNDIFNVAFSYINAYTKASEFFKNPVMALDGDVKVCNNLNLYAQAAMTTEVAYGQGYALLLGGKWTVPAKHGIFTFLGELQYMGKKLYSDRFFFNEGDVMSSFNNPTRIIFAPAFDAECNKIPGYSFGAVTNKGFSFAVANGEIKYQNSKCTIDADLMAMLCCNTNPVPFYPDLKVNDNKENVRLMRVKFTLSGTYNVMPGINVFAGLNTYWNTCIPDGTLKPKWYVPGKNSMGQERGLDGFAGIKVSL